MSRMADLLKATGKDLGEYNTPLSHRFLVDNDVTSDECLSLCDLLKILCDLGAWGLENPEDLNSLIAGGTNLMALRQVTKLLEAM